MVAPTPKSSARRINRETILGIDPGSLVTGWGLVEVESNQLHCRSHGTIATSASLGLAQRLSQIYRGLHEVIERYHPTAVSLEKVFFSRNVQSALRWFIDREVGLLAKVSEFGQDPGYWKLLISIRQRKRPCISARP